MGAVETIRCLHFRWKKTTNNRSVLIEKPDICEKRVHYLRTIQKYRQEGRPIIYMDESYIHSSYTKEYGWSSEKEPGLQGPVSTGKRAIIVHAVLSQALV